MPHAWYVTVEMRKRGILPKRRTARMTRTFETEAEAKDFARAKFDEGLVVFAGTLNPHVPKRLIPSGRILPWLEGSLQESDDVRESENDSTKLAWPRRRRSCIWLSLTLVKFEARGAAYRPQFRRLATNAIECCHFGTGAQRPRA
jgi:hypothetical protein